MIKSNIEVTEQSPLISIIIPVYNVEKYLSDCIDSIINQTYKNIDILLIDDGSSDSCPDICDSYAAKDKRIRVIHKENGGLSDARNTGIKSSTGKYLIFVDSDDKLADRDVIEQLVVFLHKNESIITFCSSVIRIFNDKTENKGIELQDELYKLTQYEFLKFTRKHNCYLAAWGFVVRRSFILENSLFFLKGILHEDYEWIPRLLLAEKNLKINIFAKAFYVYRYNPQSITSSFTQYRFDSLQQVLEILSSRLADQGSNLFIKEWFNRTLYSLFSFFEKECLSNSDLFQNNVENIKQLFRKNYNILNFRNRILFIFILINPKLFFYFRRWIKRK